MNIEELAFKNRTELTNLNETDLLNIIEFLQADRKQWINQFSKTHNENVEIQRENQELKKQLEEWEHHLKCSKEMLDVQSQKGNYDYDEYMLGMYNGMEYIISLFETREPKYISGKEVKFINNQQKEFIKYLQEELNVQIQEESIGCETTNKKYILEEILQKYKEIAGDLK